VAASIPTEIGDVLILQTDRTFSIHAVGPVVKKGQQDFHGQQVNLQYLTGHDAAVTHAKTLGASGRRIFLRNLDTGGWSEISD
jgi:hypothetical protein